MGEKWLSDVIDLGSIYEGCLNLIEAPCGAGKTTLALEKLPKEFCDASRSVLLIDTVAGSEQLLKNAKKCQYYDDDFLDVISRFSDPANEKMTVITYAKFGSICKRNPKWYLDLDTIICDEMHTLVSMRKWTAGGDENLHEIAWNSLMECIGVEDGPTVIAMTATPEPLFKAMGGYVRKSPETQKVEWYSPRISRVKCSERPRRYRPEKVVHYSNLTMLCNSVLPKGKKGIIYASHISTIKDCVELLKARGFNAVGLWSLHNESHPLNDTQLRVRTFVIENEAIPDDVDILLINRSCETSINIKSHVDYMVVHTRNKSSLYQAIGRYRGNIALVYLKWPEVCEENMIPDDFLGVKLYKSDFDAHIAKNNFRTPNGRLMGAPTFLRELEKRGYIVTAKKEKGGGRYHIITLPESPQNCGSL